MRVQPNSVLDLPKLQNAFSGHYQLSPDPRLAIKLSQESEGSMRCKIIKIGPKDACYKNRRQYIGAKGTLTRTDLMPGRWLRGRVVFDDPETNQIGRMSFYQIHVQPISD